MTAAMAIKGLIMPKVLPMCPVSSLKIIGLEKVVNSHGAIRAKKTIAGTIKTRMAWKGWCFILWMSFIGRLAFWGRLYIRNILFIRSKRQKHRIYQKKAPFSLAKIRQMHQKYRRGIFHFSCWQMAPTNLYFIVLKWVEEDGRLLRSARDDN